jgi:hypothetical protein
MVIFAAAVSFGVSLEEPSTKTKKKNKKIKNKNTLKAFKNESWTSR